MKSATEAEPRMWGSAIIGFGEYTMTYPNGREIPWMVIGFSPRKQNLTLYVGSSFPEHDDLLAELGKHSTGKGCLYIKRLSDVNIPTLKKMVTASVKHRLAEKRSFESLRRPNAGKKKTTLRKRSLKSKTHHGVPAIARQAHANRSQKQQRQEKIQDLKKSLKALMTAFAVSIIVGESAVHGRAMTSAST